MEKSKNKLTSNAQELRKNMTKEERHLWYDFLKAIPINVNRQKVIGEYIVDFYIPSKNIVNRRYTTLWGKRTTKRPPTRCIYGKKGFNCFKIFKQGYKHPIWTCLRGYIKSFLNNRSFYNHLISLAKLDSFPSRGSQK